MIRTAKEHLSGTETTDRAVRVDQTARKIARSAECVRVRNHGDRQPDGTRTREWYCYACKYILDL